MTVKTGSAWAGTFVTLDATGALATPSSGPAGVLYVDGTANAATVTITGSNPYKWAVTLPSLTAGQRVDMYITATIATIATAGFVASAQADTALLSEVKTDTAAILADTGTDGVKVASLATDSITADALKADAVTKLQTGLALEATLTAIKGAGWTNETLAAIDVLIDAIKAKTDNLPASPAPANEYDARMTAIQADLDNPAQYKADVSGLATATDLATVDGIVDAIKAKTDLIPASPASAGEYTAAIAAIQADLDNPDQYKADVSGIPDAILAKVIVGTLTLEQVLKVLAAVEIGITTGGGTETIVYTGIDGTIIRLTGVDENGNRTAVIVTPGA